MYIQELFELYRPIQSLRSGCDTLTLSRLERVFMYFNRAIPSHVSKLVHQHFNKLYQYEILNISILVVSLSKASMLGQSIV